MINLKDEISLKNKNIIINGGLGLIGNRISTKCLEAGAKVLIIDNNKGAISNFKIINDQYKEQFKIINKNSADKKNIGYIVSEIKKFKNANTFVNCSYPKDKYWNKNTFSEKNINSFLKNIELNFISNFWLSKEIAEVFKSKKKQSSIILFSSIYGMVGQDLEIYDNSKIKENLTYSIIKGGIINFTKLMASNYSKHNIRINVVSPGGVRDKNNKTQNKKLIKNYSKRVPFKRMAHPDEIANTVIFLCSDLSSYMSGSNLVVDGGWTSI